MWRKIEVTLHEPGKGYWREESICRTDLDQRENNGLIQRNYRLLERDRKERQPEYDSSAHFKNGQDQR